MPKDHPLGGCGATFTSDADPEAIIAYYQTVLRAAGWTVGEPEFAPMTNDDGDQIGSGVGLGATKESMGFSIGAELLDGPESPTYNVMVAEGGT